MRHVPGHIHVFNHVNRVVGTFGSVANFGNGATFGAPFSGIIITLGSYQMCMVSMRNATADRLRHKGPRMHGLGIMARRLESVSDFHFQRGVAGLIAKAVLTDN